MKKLLLAETLSKEVDPAFRRRARIVIEQLDLKPGEKILEAGCGRGFYGNLIGSFFPRTLYVGIDINENYLQVAKTFATTKNVKFNKADATKLPFENETFDKVLCTEALEHIENDRKVLSEIYRVLKPKGIVLITVPNKNYPFFWDPVNWLLERSLHTHIPSRIWWLAGIWADHIRLYTESELVSKLQSTRFTIQNVWRSTHYSFPFSHFLLYGIGKNIVEVGLCKSFSRFSNKSRGSFFTDLSLHLFNLFDAKNENTVLSQNNSFLNIIIKVKK